MMSLIPSVLFKFLALTIATLICATPISQQQNDQKGILKGIVVDLNDARVITTKILIENKSYRGELGVDSNGEFAINLLPGKYKLTAEAREFYKYRRKNIQIKVGETTTLSIKLKVLPHDYKCPPNKICL